VNKYFSLFYKEKKNQKKKEKEWAIAHESFYKVC